MKQNGFTLVEMMVALGVIAVLVALSTMAFKSRSDKDRVETQVKTLYADLMNVRAQSLFQKRGRSVTIATSGTPTASVLKFYSTNNVAASPAQSKTLKLPVNPASLQIDFDQRGVGTFNGFANATGAAICTQVNNNANVDSILLTKMQISIGLLTGTGCTRDKISRK